jgi:ABC-type multidrug transport system fused ATPase/permease subunit
MVVVNSVSEAVRESLGMLSRRDRRRLFLAIFAQSLTSVLDLVGVLLIAWVGFLAAGLVQGEKQFENPFNFTLPMLNELSPVSQVLVIAIAAAVILGLKSLISALISRKVLIFLAMKQSVVASRLVNVGLGGTFEQVKRRRSEEIVYALTYGLNSATLVILGHLIVIVSEITLIFLMSAVLIFVEPLITAGVILFFSLIGVSLYQIMGRWATDLGTARANVDQGTLRLINESIMSFRELAVLGRRDYLLQRIKDLRAKSARVEANFQFLSLVPKYVLELGIVVGAAGLTYFLVSTRDPVTAFGVLALFLATTSRIIPSLLRLQVAGLGIRSASAAAEPTFRLQGEVQTAVRQGLPTNESTPVLGAVEMLSTITSGSNI